MPKPSPSPSASPSPTPSPSAAPLPAAAPVGTAPCQTPKLEVAFLGANSGTGHTLGEFEFRNTSMTPCFVHGFVAVQMISASGGALETHIVRDPGTQATVTMAPGSPALGKGHAGHARFVMDWVSNCDITGTHYNPEIPAYLEITPPDGIARIRISARAGDGSSMSVCPGQEQPGTLHTKPAEAAAG